MIDTILCWECLENGKAIKSGKPWQYVAFTKSMDIHPVFGDGCKTAIATIGQRDGEGRLYQSWTEQHPHFVPRKFTITAKHAGTQIRWIYQLVTGLNDGTIDPESIPVKVCSVRAWNAIRTMLECSVGPIDA